MRRVGAGPRGSGDVVPENPWVDRNLLVAADYLAQADSSGGYDRSQGPQGSSREAGKRQALVAAATSRRTIAARSRRTSALSTADTAIAGSRRTSALSTADTAIAGSRRTTAFSTADTAIAARGHDYGRYGNRPAEAEVLARGITGRELTQASIVLDRGPRIASRRKRAMAHRRSLPCSFDGNPIWDWASPNPVGRASMPTCRDANRADLASHVSPKASRGWRGRA